MKNLNKIYDTSNFVLLTDVVPEVILEIRYFSAFNFTGARVKDYLEPVAIITKPAASALKKVVNELKKKDLLLKIYDAYRPQSAVDSFIKWSESNNEVMKPYFYPELTNKETFTRGYLFKKSSHSRGSTVDLTLFDMKTGKDLDMGSPFDYFSKTSYPEFKNVTKEQWNNRKLLRETMFNFGFEPLKTEWWHFTLKNEPYPDTYFTFPVTSKFFNGKTYGLK